MVTKAGMFSFSVPSPYETHDPIEGRTKRSLPVFIARMAPPWAALVPYIERTKQRSSATPARFGSSSLTQCPRLPVPPELPGALEEVAGLVELHVGLGERQGLVVVANEQRLVLEQVVLRRAAVHVQEDDALGAGREVGCPREPADCPARPADRCWSSDDRASPPKPQPQVLEHVAAGHRRCLVVRMAHRSSRCGAWRTPRLHDRVSRRR